jgi:hypothetical protein
VVSGLDHICALVGNNVRCWGKNDVGQVGCNWVAPPNAPAVGAPQGVSLQGTASHLVSGQQHTCAIVPGKGDFCWGDDSVFQLGNCGVNASNPPRLARSPQGMDVLTTLGGVACSGGLAVVPPADFRMVGGGAQHSCASNGATTHCVGGFGTGDGAALGAKEYFTVSPPTGFTPTAMFSGGYHNCQLLTPPGGGAPQLWCWGMNDRGQLGNGSVGYLGNAAAPAPVPSVVHAQ